MSVDLLTLGEAMVALRSTTPLRLGGTLTTSVAGAESNVAIAMARLGHHARWVGRVGDDEFGALVLRTLRAERVDVEFARVSEGRVTGLAFFDTGPGGVRRVHYRRTNSAAGALAPADVERALHDRPRVLHVTGITPALGTPPASAVQQALAAARTVGATTCLDVNFRRKLWSYSDAAHALRPLLPFVDVLIASEDELPLVADGSDEEARTKALLGIGIHQVVVKRGAGGATVHTPESTISAPALRVPVVDTIGAGDAFTAGYLSALLDRLDLEGRLHRGIVLGAAAVASPGDWEGLPLRAELGAIGGGADDAQR